MGLRFRKGIRLAPGLKLNLTKHGLSSLSVGGKGLTYNIGRKGTRVTGGVPGSGLSYSEYKKNSGGASSWLMIFFIALIIGAVYFLRS